MVERSGDRQRKFDGLKRWPFRLFIDGLSVMLQIALFLLAGSLSRYVWTVDVSVAHVVMSFTVLGIFFYIGIVVAGTSSYECPFQTPASASFRYLRDSRVIQKSFASLVPSDVVLANLTPPNINSLIYATWRDFIRSPIVSGIRSTASRVENHITTLLLKVDQGSRNARLRLVRGIQKFRHVLIAAEDAHSQPPLPRNNVSSTNYHPITILFHQVGQGFRNTKQRLVQWIHKFRHIGLVPITIGDTHHHPLIPQYGPGLRLHVRNLAGLRKQNADNARCVSWVLQKLTDPESIDPALRLAGIIRWFDSDVDIVPPFDLIVSAFEACFDSTKQLYPGMKDRAYFSARAILQINTGARAQSYEHASKYPIPRTPPSSSHHANPDLYNTLHMLEANSGPGRPTLDFPRVGTNSQIHLVWMSNLFIDLCHIGPNPTLKSWQSYFSASLNDHRPVIANTLLVWYMLLGGHIEEEVFWAVDKSYVVVLSFFQPTLNCVCQ